MKLSQTPTPLQNEHLWCAKRLQRRACNSNILSWRETFLTSMLICSLINGKVTLYSLYPCTMILNFNNSLVITRTIQNMYILHFTFLIVLYKVLHVCDWQRSFASFVSLMVSFSYYFCKPQLT